MPDRPAQSSMIGRPVPGTQNFPIVSTAFLAGNGEMANRIRAFDWNNHPFGPPETWPYSLRSALSIALHSAFPTAIYWGPDLRLLYNDAWAPIPGPRHPAALGQPAREVWSDIWHIIEPQFAEVLRKGEGLFMQDQMLPMKRHGLEEETYWNYSFTPLRDDEGNIVGVFNSGSETTANVVQRRNAEFLVAVNNAFRTSGSPQEALELSLSQLGSLLRGVRVGINERTVRNGEMAFALLQEWCAEGFGPSDRVVLPTVIGARLLERFMAGKVSSMALSDPDLEEESRKYLETVGVAQILGVPWVENGEVVAACYVHWETELDLSALDVSAVERVLETTMGWIERERSRDRERMMANEIDHRGRNILAVVQSISRMTEGNDVAEVKRDFEGRLAALSRVHGLIGRKRWTNVTFQEMAEEELEPFGENVLQRVDMTGPAVTLSPSEAQMFAMILHELTTNAVKYGFLSTPEGHLSLSWTEVTGGRIDIRWRETGLAPRDEDEAQQGGGFGSRMLAEVVQRQLDGEIRRVMETGGIRYELSIPCMSAGKKRAPELSRPPVTSRTAAKSVLILEDDVIIAMDLAATLEEAGFSRFGEFRDSDSALTALDKARPDLAVLDSNLLSGNSKPVAAWLRQNGIPFVVVAGQELTEDPDDPRSTAPHLLKPISYAQLIDTLHGL